MSEYKNGVNYRGNMSVEVKDRNPEVHTGRAVFIDDELYEKDSVYKARVDKCLEEGFHPVKDSSGGGGSSDFSTAQVTFINADGNTQAYNANVSVIKDNGIETVHEQVVVPVTVTVPLYKGVNILPIECVSNNDQSYMPTTDGSVVFDIGSRGFVVTGDGSITAKGRATS